MSSASISCQSDQIAAYIDGELDEVMRTLLEQHINDCADCRADLHEQQRLLCALDSTLLKQPALPLPGQFAEIVAVNARSDMHGMRDTREYQRALWWCMALGAAAIVFLGWASSQIIVSLARKVVYQTAQICLLAWSVAYDAASGVAVISRAVSREVLPQSHFAAFMTLILLTLAVVLLSRL